MAAKRNRKSAAARSKDNDRRSAKTNARTTSSPSGDTIRIDWAAVLGPIIETMADGELESLDAATREHPRRALRLAPDRCVTSLPLPVEPVPWYAGGYFVVSDTSRPGEWLHYAAGDYYIQDAGSMLPLALAEVTRDQWICDLCAAPGGKSTGVLEQLAGTGLLVANEVINSRLGVLQSALARTGYPNCLTMSTDVEVLAEQLGPRFDCVIVDAPCTGQTMVGRGKQVLAAYSAQQIEHSAARQQRIVRAASQLVAPGGRLVYSTCAFSWAENEAIVQYLLDEQPDWRLKQFPQLKPWESPALAGCYRVWPHRDHCAGAFAAAIVRPGDPGTPTEPPNTPFRKLPVNDIERMLVEMDWWADPHALKQFQWRQIGKLLHAFPIEAPAEWMHQAISGTAIAEQFTDRLEPHYASGWLRAPAFAAKQNIELDDKSAARYVAGESLSPPGASDVSGWVRVGWRGRPLGWSKAVGGVLKNHYPKPLRGHVHA